METLEGYLIPTDGNTSLGFEEKVTFRDNGKLDGSDVSIPISKTIFEHALDWTHLDAQFPASKE